MKITFYGAAETVTGSKHLITTDKGINILLDCGMFQGRGKESAEKNRHFGFSPQAIDFLILSHAHIDHSGLIPRLIKEGFKGPVYCTPATYDLCEILLKDSAYIQQSDAQYLNKRRAPGKKIQPLYSIEDVEISLRQFVAVPYNETIEPAEGVQFKFTDAGHILGAAVVNLQADGHKLAFTGDIGRYSNKILRSPQPFPQADTIICESTYGDRLHEDEAGAQEKLLQIVKETCVMKKGKLIIPAFSVGKTQEIVYALNKLEYSGQLPKIEVFVDSPLAINATDVMKRHEECFGTNILKFMIKDPDPFGFNGLNYIREVEASKAINQYKGPCIIISASGMMDAGRIKHHLINNLEDDRNAVLIIGYCEPSTLGGRIMNGDKTVNIFGKPVKVNATIYELDYYSAHADYAEIIRFLECQDPDKVKNLFLVHGNIEALENLKALLYRERFTNVHIAKSGVSFECKN